MGGIGNAMRQLRDIPGVWSLLDLTPTRRIERELLLVKVGCSSTGNPDDGPTRTSLTELATLFRGTIVDVGSREVVIELSAKPSRVNAFIELIKAGGFEIRELVRTGLTCIARSSTDYDDED